MASGEASTEGILTPDQSKNEIIKDEKSNEIYFQILYRRKEKEKEFKFTKYEIEPSVFFVNEIKAENGTYLYEKVFKFKRKAKKKEESKKHADPKKKEDQKSKTKDTKKEGEKKKKEDDAKKTEDKKKDPKKKEKKKDDKEDEIEIQFEIGKDSYIITFNADDKIFCFDVELKKGNKYLKNIAKENIDQNFLNYFQKVEIYLNSLKQKKEEEKVETLYKEAIKLYSKKKGFYFLISLFVNVYEKKELCKELMDQFHKMNKEKKNEKNMDRNKSLFDYVSTFSNICSNAENITKTNGYNPINFYGVILCYLNYYDYENFEKYLKKLYENSRGVIYEILIAYFSNFLNPINQDLKFYEGFIEYTINNKDFDIFVNSLNYISDIEIYINVIEKNKEKIIEKYKNIFKTITIKSDLKVNKKKEGQEIKIIIPAIKSIIEFSEEQEKLLIYFNSNFWINILKNYNESNAVNIDICFQLRELLIKYFNLIEKLFKDEKDDDEKKIKEDIKNYFERDEYAFILDKNVKVYIENNKELSDSEILGYIRQYDPYFIEEKYKYKIDTFIFDYIKFDSKDEQFIETFKGLKFKKCSKKV